MGKTKHEISTTVPDGMPTVIDRDKRPEHARLLAIEIWLIFAGIVAVTVGLIAVFLDWKLFRWRGIEYTLPVTLITFLGVFVYLFVKKGLPFTETLLGRDVNGDGFIGRAPAQPVYKPPTRIDVVYDQGRGGEDWLQFDTPEPNSVYLVQEALDRKNTTYRGLNARGFSDSEIDDVKQTLFEYKFAKPGKSNDTWEITPAGRVMLRRWLTEKQIENPEWFEADAY